MPLKFFVHDYSGHAFTAQLARELAGRGHEVVYLSFSDFATPKGRVQGLATDPPTFKSSEISLKAPFDKDNLFRRHRQQLQYARPASELVRLEKPFAVLSGNSPVEVQRMLLRAAHDANAKFVFWLQDINAEAIGRILGRRNELLGVLAGNYYRLLERSLLRKSDRVVAISEDFKTLLCSEGWGVNPDKIDVVENWAPLDDMPPHPRENEWGERNFRAGAQRIVYSGTLARKHDPEILVKLAQRVEADVYLFSDGVGAKHVAARSQQLGLENLFVRPWVSVEELPMMLAGADVLCAFIEQDAGVFSVPSKVLSYLAAGRPILASIPSGNLASRTILRAGAGLVSEPGDDETMLRNAKTLLADATLRERMGRNGRAYAEHHFDIRGVADRFEHILTRPSK